MKAGGDKLVLMRSGRERLILIHAGELSFFVMQTDGIELVLTRFGAVKIC